MKKFGLVLSLIMLTTLVFSFNANTKVVDTPCAGVKNTTTQDGEFVTMRVFYTTLGMYIGAGEANFSTTLERINGKPVYHFVGEGKGYPFFDKFFKVRDRYESYTDTATMLPIRFIRNVEEGSYKKQEDITFNRKTNTAKTKDTTIQTPPCIQDIISAVYYARNTDFTKYNPGDKIPFDVILDNEIHHLYMRYMGKDKIKTKYGKFNAIHVKPLLLKGTMFTGGENMNAWFSDDQNRLLLRVESPITVGSVKVDMYGYRNLRYPLTSLTSVR
jgi:Protein of unknown function (DUF3108)